MTDVTGSPTAAHPCYNTVVAVAGQSATVAHVIPPSGNPGWGHEVFDQEMDCTEQLYNARAHINGSSTLSSLAVSRVPAYVPEALQGIVSIAELHSVLGTGAAKVVSAFARLLSAAVRRKGGALTKAGKDLLREAKTLQWKDAMKLIIGADLEWKFGWKPFIDDVQKATQAFSRASAMRQKLLKGVRVYGTATENFEEESPWGLPYFFQSGGAGGGMSFTYTKRTNRKITASIMRRLRSDLLPDQAVFDIAMSVELYGLNPSLASMWELVPMSFVVDWFIPVGDMLQSVGGLTDPIAAWVTSYDGLLTEKTYTTVQGQGRYSLNNSITCGGFCTNSTYNRQLSSLAGLPPVYIPAGLKIPSNLSQWWTGLELALQRMR